MRHANNLGIELLKYVVGQLSKPSPQNPAMLAIVNAQNQAGNTALHWAALNGHLEAVKVLLEHGGDPTIPNARGHDAVYEAELNDKQEVVEWVLKEGGEGLEEAVSGEVADDGEDEDEDHETATGAEVTDTEGAPSKVEEGLESLDIKDDTSKH